MPCKLHAACQQLRRDMQAPAAASPNVVQRARACVGISVAGIALVVGDRALHAARGGR